LGIGRVGIPSSILLLQNSRKITKNGRSEGVLFRATSRQLRKIRLIAPRSLAAPSPRDAQWWARWPARRGRERCGDGTGALDGCARRQPPKNTRSHNLRCMIIYSTPSRDTPICARSPKHSTDNQQQQHPPSSSTQHPRQEHPFTTATTEIPMASAKTMPPWDEQLFDDDENLPVRDSALCC
jgi:hypothetical protein